MLYDNVRSKLLFTMFSSENIHSDNLDLCEVTYLIGEYSMQSIAS